MVISINSNKIMYRKTIQAAFEICCWVTFTFMVVYWLYKYKVIDRDIGALNLISLEDATDIEFPLPALCLIDPFIRAVVNSTEYVNYLRGHTNENSIEAFDYDNIILNLDDYFLFATEVWKNDTDTTINSSLAIKHTIAFDGFNSENNFVKCISPDVDLSSHRYIKTISFNYNKTKLMDDWKGSPNIQGNFGFKLHWKGQFLIGDEPIFIKFYFRISDDGKTWDIFDWTIKEL